PPGIANRRSNVFLIKKDTDNNTLTGCKARKIERAMGKSLVIVESPAKAKTINKYLGSDFVVKSSVGHIRDLPTGRSEGVDPKERARQAAATRKLSAEEKAEHRARKAWNQLVNRMGVDPEHGWKA